jgi:DNA-binding IclR family transcriptional regulator
MSDTKPASEEAIVAVLESRRDTTVSDVAAAAGLGRSTTGKVLVRLERAGRARRNPGKREGGRRLSDRWTLAAPKKPARRRPSSKRLRPGELDGLVLDHLAKHAQSGPLSATAVANGLGCSAGAVGNCLARLAAAGRVRQVSGRPRRYNPM